MDRMFVFDSQTMTKNTKNPSRPDAINWILLIIGCAAAIALAVISVKSFQKNRIFKPPVIPNVTPSITSFPTLSAAHPPPPTTVPVVPTTKTQNYILPFSNSQSVTVSDLTKLSPWELKVARNEIYARHGRTFIHKDLTCYFSKQAWYSVDSNYSDKLLSKLETANAKTILDYETNIHSPLLNTDSGCK